MAQTTNNPDAPDLTAGLPLSRLTEGRPFAGRVGEDDVVVVKQGDRVFAVGANCTHYGGPLADGFVSGTTIRCPWHHAAFDLETGENVGAPAFSGVGCYAVTVEGDRFTVGPKKDSSPKRTPAKSPDSVVILGAGAAAAAAAETLRREGYQGRITMLGEEDSGPVDRPNLSKDYLAGDAPEEWIPLGGDAHWDKLNVDLRKGTAVVAIDVAAKKVRCDDGQSFSYDRLIYATGAEPVVLPIDGLEQTRHFTLRSFADTRAIVEAAEEGQRALIVGAGFIGLEAAASLKARGLEVVVVAPDKVPLAGPFGTALGLRIQAVHEAEGVEFVLGQTVESFRANSASLSQGGSVDFDFVVLGTGVKPRTKLAEEAGLTVDDGVVVDSQLRTSDPSIYAAGDVARFPLGDDGETARIEHWVLAQRLAERAARNILGVTHPFNVDVPFFWSRHFGMTIQYIGHAPDYDEIVVDGDLGEDDAAVGFLKGGQILAIATVGRDLDGLRAELALAEDDQDKLRELLGF